MMNSMVRPAARSLLGALLGLALAGGALTGAGPAVRTDQVALPDRSVASAPAPEVVALAKSKAKGKTMAQVIANAKKKDKKAFNGRLAKLRSSSALVWITKTANARRSSLYLDFFAAVSTSKQVNKLVKNTAGKHFVVTGTKSRPRVQLVPDSFDTRSLGPTLSPQEITCWQGWVAFWAWWAGSEMTCAAFGAAVGAGMSPTGPMAVAGGVIAGTACSGLMAYLQEKFIDFNDACVNVPSPYSLGTTAEPARVAIGLQL